LKIINKHILGRLIRKNRGNSKLIKTKAMKDILDIKDIEKIERLGNEYDLQKASLLERKLRLMIDENPDLKRLT